MKKPLKALTVNLLRTYSEINRVYHQKKREAELRAKISADTSRSSANSTVDKVEAAMAAALTAQGFSNVHLIGKGMSCRVFRCKASGSDREFAIKVVLPKHASALKKEIRIIKALNERNVPHVPRILGFDRLMISADMETSYIVTDLFESTDLYHSYLKQASSLPTTEELASIAIQNLEVLLHLSELGIAHADLKPENECYEQFRGLTVFDFGISQRASPNLNILLQSRFYRAPEVILKSCCDPSMDMWSLGCMLYELYTGRPLFPARDSGSDPDGAHLYMIIQQLGMPPTEFLKKSPRFAQFFVVDPVTEKVAFKEPVAPLECNQKWQNIMKRVGLRRNHSALETEKWISLISGMLRFENRISPQEAMEDPIFQKQSGVSVSHLGLPPSKCGPLLIEFSADESEIPDNKDSQDTFDFIPTPAQRYTLDLRARCLHVPVQPGRYYTVAIRDPSTSASQKYRVYLDRHTDIVIDWTQFNNHLPALIHKTMKPPSSFHGSASLPHGHPTVRSSPNDSTLSNSSDNPSFRLPYSSSSSSFRAPSSPHGNPLSRLLPPLPISGPSVTLRASLANKSVANSPTIFLQPPKLSHNSSSADKV